MPCVLHCPSDICQCTSRSVGKVVFSANCGDYIVGALPATTVTDRYGKEPYSAPIVTKLQAMVSVASYGDRILHQLLPRLLVEPLVTAGINSKVDACEKAKHHTELFW